MTQQLTLKPIIKDMLEQAGIEDVYDFAPSAKDCACPIVIANETYERTDLLDDCEYGTMKLDVVAIRETRDEALSAISGVIYALHQTDWERYGDGIVSIRGIAIDGIPEIQGLENSGRYRMKTQVSVNVQAQKNSLWNLQSQRETYR